MRTIIRQLPNRRNFLKGKYTVEIGYPWLTYGAIMALEEILQPDFDVLEFGTGGSTLFFSKRCQSVKSIDWDLAWIEKVKKALPESSNVNFLFSDFEKTMSFIKEEPEESYEVILLDISNDYKSRRSILDSVGVLLAKDGYLIIDNYNYRHLRSFDYSGLDVYTFDDLRYGGLGTRICRKRR